MNAHSPQPYNTVRNETENPWPAYLITVALSRMMRKAAGMGYQRSENSVYFRESGCGCTSAQVMLGGSQTRSVQNQADTPVKGFDDDMTELVFKQESSENNIYVDTLNKVV